MLRTHKRMPKEVLHKHLVSFSDGARLGGEALHLLYFDIEDRKQARERGVLGEPLISK